MSNKGAFPPHRRCVFLPYRGHFSRLIVCFSPLVEPELWPFDSVYIHPPYRICHVIKAKIEFQKFGKRGLKATEADHAEWKEAGNGCGSKTKNRQ